MLPTVLMWLDRWQRRRNEKRLVATLLGLNDHHLADIGLRRDQLQPDGIHELDLPPQPRRAPAPRREHRTVAIRPSLQGCG